jgi:hypothetical protein
MPIFRHGSIQRAEFVIRPGQLVQDRHSQALSESGELWPLIDPLNHLLTRLRRTP